LVLFSCREAVFERCRGALLPQWLDPQITPMMEMQFKLSLRSARAGEMIPICVNNTPAARTHRDSPCAHLGTPPLRARAKGVAPRIFDCDLATPPITNRAAVPTDPHRARGRPSRGRNQASIRHKTATMSHKNRDQRPATSDAHWAEIARMIPRNRPGIVPESPRNSGLRRRRSRKLLIARAAR